MTAMVRHTNQTNIDYYNTNATYFSERFNKLVDVYQLREKFLSLLPENAHILDVGCGSGRDTKFFIDQGYKVTAFDASEELVKRARHYTNHPISIMKFDEMNYEQEFDGIWAMASLLHIDAKVLPEVIEKNILPALKPQGIFYCCFKYGQGEHFQKGRYFTDLNEESLQELFSPFSDIQILEIWRRSDGNPDRQGQAWINGLVQKK
jgi:SAM-dependent methyltransferase